MLPKYQKYGPKRKTLSIPPNHQKYASNTWLLRYSSTDQLAMNGVTVGGTKYMFLSANDRVVRARKGQSGVHCIKTVQGTSSTSLKVGMSPKVGWNTRKGIACGRILPFFPVHPL